MASLVRTEYKILDDDEEENPIEELEKRRNFIISLVSSRSCSFPFLIVITISISMSHNLDKSAQGSGATAHVS